MATLAFDEEVFFYPYGYQVLGNLSPIFHLHKDGGEVASFLSTTWSELSLTPFRHTKC